MINQHEFQLKAKAFRAGRLSLKQFTDLVFAEASPNKTKKGSTSSPKRSIPSEPTNASQQRAQTEGAASPPSVDGPQLPQIAPRAAESHKGDFGRVVLIGGSIGMPGAISLAGLAALRSGSGLVKVAIPSEIQSTVAAFSPCYMTIGCLSENGEFHGAALETLVRETGWADVIGLGPGMERGAAQKWIIPKLYAETEQPMVVDADGLNTLAETNTPLDIHAGQRILTPHPGEFQRLIHAQITDRQELERQAIELARKTGTIVVLKGHRTLITDGTRTAHNTTGNPGMATAGAGDVLTGIITSLVGQGHSLFDASVLGVHVHGLAGDLAAHSRGQISLVATDMIDALPNAFQSLAAQGAG